MNFIIASTFVDSLARLGTRAQTLVKQAAFDFQLAPANPGFQLHRLERAVEKNFWSARVNLDLRIILYRDADHLVLCYAAPHEEAYRWSQKRRFEIHPQTHAAQVVEIQERIVHLHKLARDAWVNTLKHKFAFINAKRFNELLQAAIAEVGAAEYSLAFLKAEWEAIVNCWGIGDEAAYLGASRKGRGTRLTARQRRAVWRVFADLLAVLDEKHYMTWERLCFRLAAELIERPPPYRHVVADEAQDFGPAEFCLLRALVAPGDDDLFLCGDAGQRIYQPRFSWKAAGIEVRGRATRLTVNYRTTEQIRRFADTLLPAALDEDGDGQPESHASVSLLKGPSPEVNGYATVEEEIAGVARRLRELTAGGFTPRDVAIFCRSETRLRERAEPALQQCGLAGHYLSDDAPPTDAHVSLGSMHRAKGLEFKVVIVMGCDEDMLPRASVLDDMVDEADRAAFVEQERQLLYVACTRARERLFVTYSGRPSCFFQI